MLVERLAALHGGDDTSSSTTTALDAALQALEA
jgi:hypothetical protein